MTVAIDTNIILDILLPDPRFQDASFTLLTTYANTDALIISEVVYGELAAFFPKHDSFTQFLRETGIELIHTPPEALWLASRAWKEFLRNRKERLQCGGCGHMDNYQCPKCGGAITAKQHIVSDFLIGGHAQSLTGRLLTRDRGFYRAYFKTLSIEAPIAIS